jgi:DnaJ-class molecular chaperone
MIYVTRYNIHCPNCNGYGYLWGGYTCTQCEGSGLIEIEYYRGSATYSEGEYDVEYASA